MATDKNLQNLVLNKVENQEVFNYMQANNLVNEDELYLIAGDTTDENAVQKSGDTMTGPLIAQNNTNYTTKQVRNIFLIQEGETLPTGDNGDICLVYELAGGTLT